MDNWKTRDRVSIQLGVHESVSHDSGWWRILEQEGICHKEISGPDTPIILFEGGTPAWVHEYVSTGGVAVVTDARYETLPFDVDYQGRAVIRSFDFPEANRRDIHAPCHMNLFRGPGYGEVRVHRERITKNGIENGLFPALLENQLGTGSCLYTGLPLTGLLTLIGDALRPISTHSEVTERITDIDKWKVADVLVHILGRAFEIAGLPKVGLSRFPGGARSVFIFRVDVDGTFGDSLRQLRDASVEFGIPTAFFLNRSLCEGDEELLSTLGPPLEVGNHGDIHNLFDDRESNLTNLQRCEDWIDSFGLRHGPWYVAPRGMWNLALAEALDELGFEFSSDFGFDTDGLPFFPRIGGRRLKALQIPVHAYSPERASRFSQENGLPEPQAEDVLRYFKDVATERIAQRLPVYFYGHPEVFGPMAREVLGRLAKFMLEKGVPILSLSEYAGFWRRRDSAIYDATLVRGADTVYLEHHLSDDVRVVVNGSVLGPEVKEIYLGQQSPPKPS